MKGIVFTEFLEMVEDRFSPQVADRIIEASNLASGGAYTAVGTYDHHEIVQLVTELSNVTGIGVPDLLRAFGRHLFGRFVVGYPQLFAAATSAFAFLASVEGHIHVEVRKLYPDAELPTFKCDRSIPGRLTMLYQSKRPFGDLAEGLIMGCAEHFDEEVDIVREDLSDEHETRVRFVLTKQHAA